MITQFNGLVQGHSYPGPGGLPFRRN